MVPHATNSIRRERQMCITHTKANKKGFTVACTCLSYGNGGKLQEADDDVKMMKGMVMIL